MWRPDNWLNPYLPIRISQAKYDAYEEGADAMLEALKKQAYEVKLSESGYMRIIYAKACKCDKEGNVIEYTGEEWSVSTDKSPPTAPWHQQEGWLTFIPEEG